jgi:hypothetical protein
MSTAPKPGESIFGESVDPHLAMIYERAGGGELGPFFLYPPGSEWNHLIPWNKRLRESGAPQFCSSLIFGEKAGFALYFATVPQLADAQGRQPVIYIEAMEFLSAVPVASSVDFFFDSYSRYVELMVVDPEYLYSGVPDVTFPWTVQQLIARDETLRELVRAGRFDFLTQDDEEAYQWVQQLCTMRP